MYEFEQDNFKQAIMTDWKKAWDYARSRTKTVRLHLEVEILKPAEFVEVYLKDGKIEHYITSVVVFNPKTKDYTFVIDLSKTLKDMKKAPSETTYILIKAAKNGDAKLKSATIELVEKK